MGAYDRFKNADPMGVRQYIDPGDHYFLVKRTEQGPSKNPTKKNVEKTVVEFKVIKSDTMKEGSVCAMVETDASQGYFGNVLTFVAGILGYEVDDMKKDPDFDAVFASVFGEEQILTDMLVHCIAQQVKTTSPQAKSDVYTAKTWEPVEAAKYEEFGLIAPEGAYTGEEQAA